MQLGYLDPGAGSMIAQVAAAGAAGMAVAVRLGWRRATRYVRRPEESPVDEHAASAPEPTD